MEHDVAGNNSGAALWPLFLFTARFPVGPSRFFFHPCAWQHVYSGFVRLRVCSRS